MSAERWFLFGIILIAAIVQYGLIAYALRDLVRRSAVRGGSRFSWALVILCVPFAGPLIYGVMGPAGFLPRPNRPPSREVSVLDPADLTEPGKGPELPDSPIY